MASKKRARRGGRPKKGSGPSKSDFIREKLKAGMSASDIVTAGAASGMKIGRSLIYNVKGRMDGKAKKVGKAPAPSAARVAVSDDALEALLTEFAERIRVVVKKEMLDAFLAEAGELVPAPKKRGPGRAPKGAGAPHRAKGGKRDPKVLEATVSELEAAIKAKPGLRIEQIGKALGVTTKELALPAKKLLSAKKIRTTGNRRATRYFPR